MTTTQTGGGNGAAPDGGSGRKLPTRPGWWMCEDSGAVRIAEAKPAMGLAIIHGDVFTRQLGSPAIEWLAPIPGPAVLAALAEYIGAIYAIDDATVDSTERDRAFSTWTGTQSRLHAAIRAERDGDA